MTERERILAETILAYELRINALRREEETLRRWKAEAQAELNEWRQRPAALLFWSDEVRKAAQQLPLATTRTRRMVARRLQRAAIKAWREATREALAA